MHILDYKLIERLGRDLEGKVSSQPPYKSGPRRGKRRSETNGVWICAGGYAFEDGSGRKAANYEWVRTMQELGIRTGIIDAEGVRNFYVFKEGM